MQRTIDAGREYGSLCHMEIATSSVACFSSICFARSPLSFWSFYLRFLKQLVPALGQVSYFEYESCQMNEHHHCLSIES